MAAKKTKKKVVTRRRKLVVETLPTRIEFPAGPVLVEGSKLLREFTQHPTKTAIDATYLFLFKTNVILKGSPVLRHFQGKLTSEEKLQRIRLVLDRNGCIPERVQ